MEPDDQHQRQRVDADCITVTMQMWPGHMDDFEGAMEASRMANMLQHVPLAMSLCRVDYANHLKMQSSLSNHMYAPSAFEG